MTPGGPIVQAVDELVTVGLPGGAAPAGVAVGLTAGELDVAAVAGLRTVDAGPVVRAPLTADTRHDLASVTKVVTTTAVLRLVSDEQIDLDDAVQRFVPSFIGDGKDSVSIRDLLLHRGGLWEWYPLYIADDPEAFVDAIPLRFHRGSGRYYSDLGFILLGRVVRVITGLTLDDALAGLVTGPLDMTATTFARPLGGDPGSGRCPEDVAMSAFDDAIEIAMLDSGLPYPVPYRSSDFDRWRTDPIVGEVHDGNAFHAFGGVAGHAGLFSTLADLLALASALSRYDDHDELWRPEIAADFFAPGPDPGQALGFRRYLIDVGGEQLNLLGHTGFVGCAVGFVPGRDIALAMASNRLVTTGPPATTEQLWQLVIAAAGAELAIMGFAAGG